MTGRPLSTRIPLSQVENQWTRIEVRLENGTVWLNQLQRAEPFRDAVLNGSMHIRNVFREGEPRQNSVVKDFLTTAGRKWGKSV